MTGHVNSHNAIHWWSTLPTTVNTRPLHSPCVTVFAGVSSHGLIGPYFLKMPWWIMSAWTVRTTLICCRTNSFQILTTSPSPTHIYPFLSIYHYWFAFLLRAHTSNIACNLITTEFGGKTIGERLGHDWPARSPDLNPCDFWMWGAMKDAIHAEGPAANLNEIKRRVTAFFCSVPEEQCGQAVQSVILSSYYN